MKSGLTKKRPVWAAVGLCVVILAAAAAYLSEEKEPEYQGKKLSEWLDESRQGPNGPQAQQAVLAIGKKGVPFFIKWVKSDQRLQRRRLVVRRLPLWAQKTRLVNVWLAPEKSIERASRGIMGFQIVGTNAASAITELRKIAQDRSPYVDPIDACSCLSYTGKDGMIALLEILRNGRDFPKREWAVVNVLGHVADRGGDVGQAIPALIASVNGSKTNGITSQARRTLEDWARDPAINEKIDPIFPHIDVSSRILIIKNLEHMGTNDEPAHWASKVALQARDDSNEGVRSAASNTLNRIKVDWAKKYDSAGSR